MATLRNAAIGVLRVAGVSNIAIATRRDGIRPLAPAGHHLTTLPGDLGQLPIINLFAWRVPLQS